MACRRSPPVHTENAIREREVAVDQYSEVTVANSTYFNMLGLAYYFKGEQNCDRAVPLFEKVLESIPEDVNSLEGLDLCRAATIGAES